MCGIDAKMPIPLRTTIRIDDQLFRQLKERAARTGRTIGQLIEDAVRESMHRSQATPRNLEALPVFGGSGVLPGVDLTSDAALLEVMEQDDDGNAAG